MPTTEELLTSILGVLQEINDKMGSCTEEDNKPHIETAPIEDKDLSYVLTPKGEFTLYMRFRGEDIPLTEMDVDIEKQLREEIEGLGDYFLSVEPGQYNIHTNDQKLLDFKRV